MGLCTVQTNIFLQGKMSTKKMKGGNTDTIYKKGTKEKSQMIQDMHPDICRVAWKFNRWHHHCNYKIFSNNKPKFKSEKFLPTKDEMILKKIK